MSTHKVSTGGISGITTNAVVYGAADGSPTWSTGLTFVPGRGLKVGTAAGTQDSLTTLLVQAIAATGTLVEIANAAAASYAALRMANTNSSAILDIYAHGTTSAGNTFGIAHANASQVVAIARALFIGSKANVPVYFGANDTMAFQLATDARIQVAAAGITANGSGAVTAPGSIGPAAISVQEWLTVKNAAGTVRYVPMYG